MREVTFIIAGNLSQAVRYARDNQLSPAEWHYLRNEEPLKGIDNPKVVRIGDWQTHPRLAEIEHTVTLNTRGST